MNDQSIAPLDTRIRRWLQSHPATVRANTEQETWMIAFARFQRLHPNYLTAPADFISWLKLRGFDAKQIRVSAEYEPPRYGYRLNLGGDDDLSERPIMSDQEMFDSSVRHFVGNMSLLAKARTITGASLRDLRRALVQTWREGFPGQPANELDVLDSIARAMGFADADALFAGAVRQSVDGVELTLALPMSSS